MRHPARWPSRSRQHGSTQGWRPFLLFFAHLPYVCRVARFVGCVSAFMVLLLLRIGGVLVSWGWGGERSCSRTDM
jgi:hypothetical protein